MLLPTAARLGRFLVGRRPVPFTVMGLTNNHRRSVALARQILSGEQRAEEIPDADWALLMLAAEVNRCDSAPGVVARRVLDAYEHMTGYFDPLKAFAGVARGTAPVEAA